MALQWCKDNFGNPGVLEIELYSDSEIVIKQLKGMYKTKAAHLSELNKKTGLLCKNFNSVSFHNVPRENEWISAVDKSLNVLLDRIAKQPK
jgi:ribonuclease HI